MRRYTRHLDRFRMTSAVRAANHIVAVSENTARDVETHFDIAPSRISVINPGITALPEPGPKDMLTDLGITAPFVLCVGTQEPRKNHKRLIEAFHKIQETETDPLQLVIAGGHGWGPLDLRQEISARGLQESVRVLGFVDDFLLSTLYAQCQFVAMPSLFEGFGMPLIEAFSHGKPVLAAGNSSMPEVVGDGGVLIDPLDIGSIASGLGALLDDQTRAGFAASASDRATLYDWDNSAATLARIFTRLVEEKA
jgi:glycosyltransferase involved in cell wall biosynthesis